MADEVAAAEVVEIDEILEAPARGSAEELLDAGASDNLSRMRHSAAHVMAEAVMRLFPGAKLGIGPAITDGFYYDFLLERALTPDDLAAIEAEMAKSIAANHTFALAEHTFDDERAALVRADQLFKIEIMDDLAKAAAAEGKPAPNVTTYQHGEFQDLCRGPHVESTGKIGPFKLLSIAGAYWRGKNDRPMLQRIYGTAWESKAALEEHLTRLAEAEKRDHRRLATELDLLSFPSELGGGLAVWHPKGAIVRKLMEDYSRARHEREYQFVYTPHLANANLFATSGHLDFYKDGMYPPMEMDNGVYYPKPMNCPMHCLIFRSRQRSYRELPLRLFELGTVYRYERAGTLHGLMRIRGFTQDDSHIYCTEDQLQAEIISLLDFIMSVLRAFGFNEFTANLSTKDPNKYVGSDSIWEKATEALRGALDTYGLEYKIKEGDAAFYGPKIDIDVRDAIGRKWQLSTIQCDFNLPDRFELEYVGSDNARHRPIMVHRALFGSVERFFGVLVEHFAGAFPAWLAPVQVKVLAVAQAHEEYASSIVQHLSAQGFRAEAVIADDQLGKRIRNAKVEKVPYVLVVGDDDLANGTVGVNPRGGDVQRDVALKDFVNTLRADVAEAAIPGLAQ